MSKTDNTTCGTCYYFIGAGDYDLCCAIGARRLCYEISPKCDKYKYQPNTGEATYGSSSGTGEAVYRSDSAISNTFRS